MGRGEVTEIINKICSILTPTVRRHSLSTDLDVIMTALDGGALTLPHRRGRGICLGLELL